MILVEKGRREKAMAQNVEKIPLWLKKIPRALEGRKEFQEIVNFYVLHTPCEGITARAMLPEDYGWKSNRKLNVALKKEFADAKKILFVNKIPELYDSLGKVDLYDFPKRTGVERACIHDGKNNQFKSLFFHLRNAFAHGRFNVEMIEDGVVMYVLEDFNKNKKEITARMIFREQTLLKWMEIIKKGGEV